MIDKISVDLNTDRDVSEATFSALGIKTVIIDSGTVKTHPKLLVSGSGASAMSSTSTARTGASRGPWVLCSIKPIQLSKFDYNAYLVRLRPQGSCIEAR